MAWESSGFLPILPKKLLVPAILQLTQFREASMQETLPRLEEVQGQEVGAVLVGPAATKWLSNLCA